MIGKQRRAEVMADLFGIGLLVVAGTLIWSVAVDYSFVWDDQYFISRNPAIRSIEYLPSYFTDMDTMSGGGYTKEFILFRPLRNISYLFDFLVTGLEPGWWHLHNVILHILNSVLVYLLAHALLRSRIGAFFAGALFLLHPVQTEAVAWIKCRDDLLAAVFVLSAFMCWLKWRGKKLTWLKWLLFTTLFLLATLSKAQAIAFAAIPIVFSLWTRKHKSSLNRDANSGELKESLKASAILIIVSGGYLLWRDLFIGHTSQCGYLAGNLWATMLTMSRVAVKYLQLIIWPHNLLADYSGMQPSVSLADWRVSAALLLLACIFAVCLLLRNRAAICTFGLVWLAMFLIPVSNVVPMMQYMAERFLYLPMIGAALCGGALLLSLAKQSRMVAVTAMSVILILCVAKTQHRLPAWKNSVELFTVTTQDTPPSALRPRRNLLSALVNRGYYERALPLAQTLGRQTVENDTATPRKRAKSARVLGFLMVKTGNLERGRELLQRAIEADPDYSEPYMDLGVMAGLQEEPDAALAWFRRAVKADPSAPHAYYNLGIALRESGQVEEAAQAFRTAIRHAPRNANPHKSLATLLWKSGDISGAVDVYDAALEIWPQDQEIQLWREKGKRIIRSLKNQENQADGDGL